MFKFYKRKFDVLMSTNIKKKELYKPISWYLWHFIDYLETLTIIQVYYLKHPFVNINFKTLIETYCLDIL